MDPLHRRLDRLEQQHGLRPQAAYAFVPIDVAHTDGEAVWLAKERQRQGLGPNDDLVTFCWGEVQA